MTDDEFEALWRRMIPDADPEDLTTEDVERSLLSSGMTDGDVGAVMEDSPPGPDWERFGLIDTAAVWREWNALPEEEPSPVKTIAARLGYAPADVAAVVYPPETFGAWEPGQEP